jgi:ATP-dependent DNA ligase
VFDALHRRGTVREALLQAFDLLELNGADLRPSSLGERKARLAKLLRRGPAGIEFNHHTSDDGAIVFAAACSMGLEGIVSKRLAAPYRSGPSRDWLKVKNPDSPAMVRARKLSGKQSWEKTFGGATDVLFLPHFRQSPTYCFPVDNFGDGTHVVAALH